MPRTREGHIQRVQLFATTRQLLGRDGLCGAGRRPAFADQEDELLRPRRLAGPVDQHAHAVCAALCRIKVKQQHGLGFQPLGAVNRQQPYCAFADRGGRQRAAGFQGTHESIRRGITPAVQVQRHCQQRAQIGQHGAALQRRRGGGKARQHIAVVVNRLQRVVRRQAVNPTFPSGQNGR